MKRFLIIIPILVLLASIALLLSLSPGFFHAAAENETVSHYSKIPGVTPDEISQIEALKAKHSGFSYGTLQGFELYTDGDLKKGFAVSFCKLLSGLFEANFTPVPFSDCDVTGEAYDNVNFSTAFSQSLELPGDHYTSQPIAEHALMLFAPAGSDIFSSSEDYSGMKIGFFRNTSIYSQIALAYNTAFEPVNVQSCDEALAMLRSGELDACIAESDYAPSFTASGELLSRRVFPLVYSPVSISTSDKEFAVFISVFDKYLDYLRQTGSDLLSSMYEQDELEYMRYTLFNSLDEAQKAYLNNLTGPVEIGFEYDNYPVNYYNEAEQQYQGIAMDVLDRITRLTGIEFQPVMDSGGVWAGTLERVRLGDLPAAAQIIYTEARHDSYLWPDKPYFTSYCALLSKSDYPNLSINTAADRRIGYVSGTAFAVYFKRWFPSNNSGVGYVSLDAAFDALESGEIDLLLTADYALQRQINYREKTGYKTNILLTTPVEYALAFNKNEDLLCSIVNKAQDYIDFDSISRSWTNRMFDYAKKAAEERARYLMLLSLLLLIAVLFLLALAFRIAVLNRRLESTVKERTRDLEEKSSLLGSIYDSIPDILFSMDADHHYLSCNPGFAELCGMSADEIIGKSEYEVFCHSHDMANNAFRTNSYVYAGNGSYVYEQELTGADGISRIYEFVKAPIYGGGALIGLVAIARDITKRKSTEAAANAASVAKSSFLARMSHEIRTPLNAIIGMSFIAKSNITNPEKALNSVEHIITSSHHLLDILNDVLDMSKIESGKLELFCEPFLLSRSHGEMSAIIGQRCYDKNIEFITNIDSVPDYTLIGDKLRLNQVLINLLGNAVKFTAPGGRITFMLDLLSDTEKDVTIKFVIADNGIGISTEQIPKLFGAFEQADSGIAARFGGTGLGLSISQNLVNMMGGTIEVRSELNAGTEFSFSLTFPKGEVCEETQTDAVLNQDWSGRRILIVEDIEINRIIVTEVLSETKLLMDEAADGSQALEMFSSSPVGYYDLILMDIQMPVMNGYESTTAIRALDRADAGVPIVAMTANAYSEDIEAAKAHGMNAHIAKPLDVGELFRILSGFFNDGVII